MTDMSEFIKNLFKIILAVLPFVALCFINIKVNLPKVKRSKQFLMPLVAIVYVIVAMLLMNKINNWLLNIIYGLPDWIVGLADYSWMPESVVPAITQIADYVRNLITNLNLNFWIFFISNIVVFVAFLLLKKISVLLMATIKDESIIHSKISGRFYEFFYDRGIWCIANRYADTRTLMKTFYIAAVVISSLLTILSRYFYFNGLLKSMFYPVFCIIVVGELYFYLDGLTKNEYVNDVLGENEDAYKIVNYSLLRKFLRNLFGDKELAENSSVNNALEYGVTNEELLQNLEMNEDQKVMAFATYFNALNKSGFELDHNYLYSSLDLLNGKSILFNNPFYYDLIPYAFYPLNRSLLSHKKVLVILGRHAIEDDVKEWIQHGIESVTNIPFMWKIKVLDSDTEDCDIGIITRSDVLNIELHDANSDFLSQVGFVVVLEPSKLVSTAQIGLNLIVKRCLNSDDKDIVYCLCDKNCDGLVDAMSHTLMTSITEVSATKKHQGTVSYMCWESDNDYLHHRIVPNISRYLGFGTELSFAALKSQVTKTEWYGGEAFPVLDMKWIDKQYYYDLMKYAGLPTNQEFFDEHFIVTSNFWNARIEPYNYFTVEDESYNMFEILRDFSTRTTDQGFVNVISTDYLLKDYMADNASIFEADAKAIPYIVADYARSNRNTVLRLILMMSASSLDEAFLANELSIMGMKPYDLKKQLWYEIYKCYASVRDVVTLSEDYNVAVDEAYERTIKYSGMEISPELIVVKEEYNIGKAEFEILYSITDRLFISRCVNELKSAGYVAEDEQGDRHYLGSELCGHIYQKYLPGQFFTFGGKYYEMQYLTAGGQALVRRAADHITGRTTYRQIRDYTINGIRPSDKIGAHKDISGIKVSHHFVDMTVKTPGYYHMLRYNDFSTAKRISFEGDNTGIPVRTYNNKEILKIELPDCDGKFTDTVRYTITMLFNEIFRTVFAENQAYICAVTDTSFLTDYSDTRPMTYSLCAHDCELQKNCIYVIEDSQLDLGLTVAVERYLERILHIAQDYMQWNADALICSQNPAEPSKSPVVFNGNNNDADKGSEGKIKGGISKFVGKVKKIFTGRKKNKTDEQPDASLEIPKDQPVSGDGNATDDISSVERKGKKGLRRKKKKKAEKPVPVDENLISIPLAPADQTTETAVDTDENVIAETGGTTETDNCPAETEINEVPAEFHKDNSGNLFERKPYHERCYLHFGNASEPSCIDTQAAFDYLSELGLSCNPLTQARYGKDIAAHIEATYKPNKSNSRYCDFCGVEIFGVEYETLTDGRDRCINCGRTAIKTEEEFRKIFEAVRRNMESFFGIRINAGIRVEMVNSRTLHKRLKQPFKPTSKVDPRILGVAIKDKSGYKLMIESGSPRMQSMLTIAHELTHIWQYLNWDDKKIKRKYGKNMRLEIYEGMAKWVEIQYAYLINEQAVAKREEIITSYRDDEYGRGFIRYRANYPFSTGTIITRPTPFMNVETPLDPQFCEAFDFVPPDVGMNQPIEEGGPKPGTPVSNKPVKPLDKPEVSTDEVVEPLPEVEINDVSDDASRTFRLYAYELLNEDEKRVYEKLYVAISDFTTLISDFEVQITKDQIAQVSEYIRRDHPELYWFRQNMVYYLNEADLVCKVEIKYCLTKDEAAKRNKEIEKAIVPFISSVTADMNDFDIALKVYDNIINLVDYDSVGLQKQDSMPEISPEDPDDLRSVYGVFVNRKAVCAGYTRATQYLLNMFGIECVYVSSGEHAWNLVKLEGDYYHLDTTWGDSSNTNAEKNTSDKIGYDCFCITTAELLKLEEHTPSADLPLPECTAVKCNYHHRLGLYLDSYDEKKVKMIICHKIAQGNFDVSLKASSQYVFDAMFNDLVTKQNIRNILTVAEQGLAFKLDMTYSYSCRKELNIITFNFNKV